MSLKVTKEVINGAIVTRFNGNNCGGGREGDHKERSRARAERLTKAQKAEAKRRAKERLYERRYLGG